MRQLDLGADSAASPASRAASSLQTSAALLDAAHRLAPALASLQPALHRLTLPLAAVDVVPLRAKLATGIDGLFRDRSAAEAREQLEDLLAQARRRYASDPAMLANVERLLHAEAHMRGVS